jgi:hypothetical protein
VLTNKVLGKFVELYTEGEENKSKPVFSLQKFDGF